MQVHLKEAVLPMRMAYVEAMPEWEYHLQTGLERGIVRERTSSSRSGVKRCTYHVPCCAGTCASTGCCLG